MSENCSFKIIHPEYKIVGFDGTGRVYSSNPSLSQIPKINFKEVNLCQKDKL